MLKYSVVSGIVSGLCGFIFLFSGCIMVHHIKPEFAQDGTVNIHIRTDSDDPNVNVAVDDVMVTWEELQALMEMKKKGLAPPAGAKTTSSAVSAAVPVITAPAITGSPSKATHSVQAGAYIDPDNARQQADRLAAKGYPARVLPLPDAKGRIWHLVRVGDFPSAEQARAAADAFTRAESQPSAVRPYGKF